MIHKIVKSIYNSQRVIIVEKGTWDHHDFFGNPMPARHYLQQNWEALSLSQGSDNALRKKRIFASLNISGILAHNEKLHLLSHRPWKAWIESRRKNVAPFEFRDLGGEKDALETRQEGIEMQMRVQYRPRSPLNYLHHTDASFIHALGFTTGCCMQNRK